MNNEKIIEYFSKFKKITITAVEKFKKQNLNEYNKLCKILEDEPQWVNIQNVIIGMIENKQLKKCKTCGKIIPFIKWEQDYCSKKCINNDEIRKKIKQTCLEKYGVDNAAKSNDVKMKSKQTCLEKYGVEFTTQSEQMKNAAKQTCLEKYGVEHYINIDKQKQTILKKSFEKYLQFSDVIPLFSLDEYSGVEYYKQYKWKCKKCYNEFMDHLYSHVPLCPFCNDKQHGRSTQEKNLFNFIKSIYDGEIIENDRTIIKPLELDIVIPEKKIAFEFNGTFWHSESSPGFNKNKNKCLIKTNKCNDVGYKLIHIWEHDWVNKNNLIKEKIKALLGIDQTKIYGRNCIVNEICPKIKNQFLNENHIQGEDKSNIKLGLFHENELVAIMTFGKPRFNKNYEYELIRYATKSGNHVIGGAGKLLKYFERNYNPKSIITYADRFYSQGNMYRQLGFNEFEKSSPGYFYVNSNGIKVSRYQCQKHNLRKFLGDKFHNELSEFENMLVNNFHRVYDCGNYVFIKLL